MYKKSIIFIEPKGNNANVFDSYMQLPLMGSLYLGTILHNKGYNVRIYNENLLSKQIDPSELQADVFCITALTVSASRAKYLAGQLKKLKPSSTVIVGGIHASLLPDYFTDVANHVVTGEADEIILDVIEGKYKEKIISGSKTQKMNELPIINYNLLENANRMKIIPIMSSRGCPFNCNFCTVTKVFGRVFRKQSPQKIVEDIENALTYFKSKSFFFYDDNFTADKERVSKFCDLIIEKGLKICWAAQVRSDLARDPELVQKMIKAGLDWVYIGFESIDDLTLKALHKSQTRADIEVAIKTFRELGVRIHGMFMFGEDHDTVDSISKTVDFAIENKIDTVQFMILTPFPGTQCYENIIQRNRLLHKNWDYYNGMYIVFKPKNMSPVTLYRETYKAYKRFYSLKRTLWDSISLMFRIFKDALVLKFDKINKHSFDIIFIRSSAYFIISKNNDNYSSYLKALDEPDVKKLTFQRAFILK